MRNPKNDFNKRIIAYTYNAGQYIINKHMELGHAGISKIFLSLQGTVYSIRRKDVTYLIN